MSEHDAEGKQPPQGNAAPWPAPPQPRSGAQWGQPFGNVPYGNAPYGNAPSGNSPYANVPYGNPPYSNPPYAGHPFAGQPHGSPFGQPRYAAPPKPGIVPLRPLMFGEIMDGSFQTIRRNARAMLGAAVLAQALAAILAAVLTAASATSAGFLVATQELISDSKWKQCWQPYQKNSSTVIRFGSTGLAMVLTGL